jgi:hypothetical protein
MSGGQQGNLSMPCNFFAQLDEELVITIFSYIADAPFEGEDDIGTEILEISARDAAASGLGATDIVTPARLLSNRCMTYTSTLTHVLPLVCKQFRLHIGEADRLWKAALLRQLTRSCTKYIDTVGNRNCNLWLSALQDMVNQDGASNKALAIEHQSKKRKTSENDEGEDEDDSNHQEQTEDQLMDQAYHIVAKKVQSQQNPINMSYQYLYRTIVNTQLRKILPVFFANWVFDLSGRGVCYFDKDPLRSKMMQLIHAHNIMVQQQQQQQPSRGVDPKQLENDPQSIRSLLQQFPLVVLLPQPIRPLAYRSVCPGIENESIGDNDNAALTKTGKNHAQYGIA